MDQHPAMDLKTVSRRDLVILWNQLVEESKLIGLPDMEPSINRDKMSEEIGARLAKISALGLVTKGLHMYWGWEQEPAETLEAQLKRLKIARQDAIPKKGRTPLKVVSTIPVENVTRRGRVPAARETDIITVLVEHCPKQGKAAERFRTYRSGMTVAEYGFAIDDRKLALRDIAWDTSKGWIKLQAPPKSE